MIWIKWGVVTFVLLIPALILIFIKHAGKNINTGFGQWGANKLKRLIEFKNKIAPMPKLKAG